MKKMIGILAAMLLLFSFAIVDTVSQSGVDYPKFDEVVGFWMNCGNGITSLEIHEDGSGSLTDLMDGMGVPIQVKAAEEGRCGYIICLGGEDFPNDLTFDAETESLIMNDREGGVVTFIRDYWDAEPVAVVPPDLSIRYSPEAFDITGEEDGSLMMTFKYRNDGRDYIRLSLVKDTDMATVLEGLALQSGMDDVHPDYGCWDFTEDQAGSVDYIRNEKGVDYDNFFMAVKHGHDCYLVECHTACLGDPEIDPENSLTGLYEETLGSIRKLGTD